MIKLSQCQEAVSLLYFSVTEINLPFFCRSAIFFPAFSTLCLFILGRSQSWLMCDITLSRYLRRLVAQKQLARTSLFSNNNSLRQTLLISDYLVLTTWVDKDHMSWFISAIHFNSKRRIVCIAPIGKNEKNSTRPLTFHTFFCHFILGIFSNTYWQIHAKIENATRLLLSKSAAVDFFYHKCHKVRQR